MTAIDDLRRHLAETSDSLSVYQLDDHRFSIIHPLTFDDGDGVPLVVESPNGAAGWRLTDEGAVGAHLSYDMDPTSDRMIILAKRIAARHGMEFNSETWTVSRTSNSPPSLGEVLEFLHGLIRLSDLIFTVQTRTTGDFRLEFDRIVDRLVPAGSVEKNVSHREDVDEAYQIDYLFNGDRRVAAHLAWSDQRAKEAIIVLQQWRFWTLHEDVELVAFIDGDNLGPKTMTRLDNTARIVEATESGIRTVLPAAGVGARH